LLHFGFSEEPNGPLDVKAVDGDVEILSLDSRYAQPGAEEVQKF